jgi:phosphoribosylanthranilate isomerase
VQLHGDEGPVFCAEVARRSGARVIKAASVSGAADLRAMEPFHTDFHLLDAPHATLRGGTGTTWDWGMLAHRRSDVPLILSGGLDASNVGAAIEAARPFAVDAASGTETAPGVKDPERVRAFAAAVQAVERAAA